MNQQITLYTLANWQSGLRLPGLLIYTPKSFAYKDLRGCPNLAQLSYQSKKKKKSDGSKRYSLSKAIELSRDRI